MLTVQISYHKFYNIHFSTTQKVCEIVFSYQSDKEIMKNAEKLIFDEFAFALETDVKGVRKIINKKLG